MAHSTIKAVKRAGDFADQSIGILPAFRDPSVLTRFHTAKIGIRDISSESGRRRSVLGTRETVGQ